MSGRSSEEERHPPKMQHVGSIPTARSISEPQLAYGAAESVLEAIGESESVSVTLVALRLGLGWRGRRQVRVALKRLVRGGILHCRPRDTKTGRGGRLLFWRNASVAKLDTASGS